MVPVNYFNANRFTVSLVVFRETFFLTTKKTVKFEALIEWASRRRNEADAGLGEEMAQSSSRAPPPVSTPFWTTLTLGTEEGCAAGEKDQSSRVRDRMMRVSCKKDRFMGNKQALVEQLFRMYDVG